MNQQQRRVLFACTIGNVVSMTPAVHAVFGTFLVPLSETFDWPRAAISGALTIMALVAAIFYPFAGRYVDRNGARTLLLAGVVVMGLGIACLSLGNGSLPLFYATFFLISLGGSAAATPIYAKLVTDWFHDGRGTALGVSSGLGNGAGSVLFPVVTALVLATAGWRMAYLAIAAMILFLGLPILVALLRDAPAKARHDTPALTQAEAAAAGLTLTQAVRLPQFWIITLAVALSAGCTTAIFSHVVPILADRGYGIDVGTTVVSVFALATSGWQIACGRLLDKVQTPRVVMPMLAMAIVGLLLLLFGTSIPALIGAGLALGIGMGAQYGALPYFIARYFGSRAFGAIIGLMYSAVIAAQGITPVLLDHAYDIQGTYRMGVLCAGAVLAVAAALLAFLPRYGVRLPAGGAPAAVPAVA